MQGGYPFGLAGHQEASTLTFLFKKGIKFQDNIPIKKLFFAGYFFLLQKSSKGRIKTRGVFHFALYRPFLSVLFWNKKKDKRQTYSRESSWVNSQLPWCFCWIQTENLWYSCSGCVFFVYFISLLPCIFLLLPSSEQDKKKRNCGENKNNVVSCKLACS